MPRPRFDERTTRHAAQAQQLRYAIHALTRVENDLPEAGPYVVLAMKHILGAHAYVRTYPAQAPTVGDLRALVITLACALGLMGQDAPLTPDVRQRMAQAGLPDGSRRAVIPG